MTGRPIDLREWLERLGFGDGEWLQLCTQVPGEKFAAVALSKAPSNMPRDRHVWVGPNPVGHFTTGRPSAEDITRLAALHIDLDVKPGGCPSFDVARAIVDELSGMLGDRPVAVTYSGHGIQPVWAVDDAPITDGTRGAMRALLRRWGRLVAAVAEKRGAKVDSLYDLTRVLRAPGGVNVKDAANPRAVHCFADTGAPISVERIAETLDEYGVAETPGDTRDPGTVVSAPADWRFGIQTCGYAAKMAQAWAGDDPAARHPWLVQQAVRIAAAHRYGCLDEAGRRLIAAQLVARFHQLITRDKREEQPGEIADAFGWGVAATAAMSDSHLASELGYHLHAEPLTAPERKQDAPTTSTPDRPADVRVDELPTGVSRDVSAHAGQDALGEGGPALPTDALAVGSDPFDLDGELGHGATDEAARTVPGLPDGALRAVGLSVDGGMAASSANPGDGVADDAATPDHAQAVLSPAQQAAADLWAEKLEAKALELRLLDEAREAEQVRKAGAVTIPPLVGLGAFLAVPDKPVEYRVEGLWPVEARVLLAAQFKAGKTTNVGNLTRALVDGVPFLDAFTVSTPARHVVIIDDEMSENQLRRWLRSQNIANVAAVSLVALRGQVGTFNLMNPAIRRQWSDNLRAVGADVVIFDCLRPVLDAIGLSEDKESGLFLDAFSSMLFDAGISDAAVVHHMGHGGERSRGDSRLRDWPDVEWRLIRDVAPGDEDPAAPVYFTAFGRDVSVPEGLLSMDPDTRRLTYDGAQTRADAKAQRKAKGGPIDATPDLLAHLAMAAEALSGRQIEAALQSRGHTVRGIRTALQAARDAGDVVTSTGRKGALMHSLNPEGVSVRESRESAPRSAPRVALSSSSSAPRPYVVGVSHSLDSVALTGTLAEAIA